MTSYSRMYFEEVEAHRKTKARLTQADHFIQTFREFLRLKDLRQDFLEWTLAKHLGEKQAQEFLASIPKDAA